MKFLYQLLYKLTAIALGISILGVSSAAYASCEEAFEIMDQNGDGVITKEEASTTSLPTGLLLVLGWKEVVL